MVCFLLRAAVARFLLAEGNFPFACLRPLFAFFFFILSSFFFRERSLSMNTAPASSLYWFAVDFPFWGWDEWALFQLRGSDMSPLGEQPISGHLIPCRCRSVPTPIDGRTANQTEQALARSINFLERALGGTALRSNLSHFKRYSSRSISITSDWYLGNRSHSFSAVSFPLECH